MSTGARFELLHRDGAARRGTLRLAHGDVETPAFMPVGTHAAIKALTIDQVESLGAQIVLANTYHLHLRPGDHAIARAGGLHAFTGWDRPMLTDSGGYQVFSLASRRTVTEDGVLFRSHLDGAACQLTPENTVEIQARLGADVAMIFDECAPWPATHDEAEAAMTRTARWARRGRDHFARVQPAGQLQFGIVQGGTFKDLRDRSVAETVAIGFDGYAIGGLSVGEPAEELYDITAHTAAQLPETHARYLMGVGMPDDLVESVARGIDMFDCVLPTRNARNHQAFTHAGPIVITHARYATDDRPIEEGCGCAACRRHSRAYLRHLAMAGEMASATLLTLHNLHFYLDTMRRIRKAIEFGTFEEFRRTFRQTFARRPPPVHS